MRHGFALSNELDVAGRLGIEDSQLYALVRFTGSVHDRVTPGLVVVAEVFAVIGDLPTFDILILLREHGESAHILRRAQVNNDAADCLVFVAVAIPVCPSSCQWHSYTRILCARWSRTTSSAFGQAWERYMAAIGI